MTDKLSNTIAKIKPLDEKAMQAARERQDDLTKPRGSLGQLEAVSIKIAGITGKVTSKIENKAVIVMAADHGVVAEGVSAYLQEVTPQMVLNFMGGGAAINVLSSHVGARVVVVDMGVANPLEPSDKFICKSIGLGTANMAQGPAMTREQAIAAVTAGIEVVEGEIAKGLDIVGTGDMGIGNTTASTAICAVITGKNIADITGRGAGLDDTQLAHKTEVLERVLKVNKPDPSDGLDILSKVGGFEIGGLAGVILGAAANGVPVVIDGLISGAAALIAHVLCSQSRDYMIAAHLSVEPGHIAMLQRLELKPLLDLGLRLGEGTGGALGISLAEAALRTLAEMTTFSEAGVSDKED
ncbi:nicotinate-nucleotide--dimethylbenzimidazole phosphoribosyltransferase [Chloroflexota bacterium]